MVDHVSVADARFLAPSLGLRSLDRARFSFRIGDTDALTALFRLPHFLDPQRRGPFSSDLRSDRGCGIVPVVGFQVAGSRLTQRCT